MARRVGDWDSIVALQGKDARVLTPEEARLLLRVSDKKMYRMLRCGEIAASRAGRTWRIDGRAFFEKFFGSAETIRSRPLSADFNVDSRSAASLSAVESHASGAFFSDADSDLMGDYDKFVLSIRAAAKRHRLSPKRLKYLAQTKQLECREEQTPQGIRLFFSDASIEAFLGTPTAGTRAANLGVHLVAERDDSLTAEIATAAVSKLRAVS